MALGQFDPTAVPVATSDETTQSRGWFDPDLLDPAPPAVTGIGWLPSLPSFIQRSVASVCVVAMPILPPPGGLGWQAQPDSDPIRVSVPYRSVIANPLQPPVASAADAASSATGDLLAPRLVVHNQAIAGPMARGQALGWTPKIADSSRLSPRLDPVVAAPVTVPVAAGVTWIFPSPPDAVRRAFVPESVLVRPSIATATSQQGVTWWPEFPDRVVQRIRFQEPLTVGPPSAPTLPSAADASTGSSSGQLSPPQTIQYQAIAGPVLVPSAAAPPFWTPKIAESIPRLWSPASVLVLPSIAIATQAQNVTWWPKYPTEPIQRLPQQPSIYAAPAFPQVVIVPLLPLQYSQDGLIRPDTATQNVAVAGPVAIPITVGWWPRLADTAVEIVRHGRNVYARPLQPPAAQPGLPWLMTGAPLILPQYPTRHVLALNPTTPAPPTVLLPWLVPPGQVIYRPVARYETVYAKPIQPQDPSGRSDLPWLPQAEPSKSALRFIQSVISAPVSPTAPPLVHGWWCRQPDLVRLLRENPHIRAVPIKPLNPDGRSDLPWLPQAPPGKAKPVAAPSSMALPPPGSFLAPLAQTDWIIIVPSWPDTITVDAYPDVIIVAAFPDDVDVP